MRKYKVLVVDDEPIIREGISNALKWDELGFELMGSCEDGFDALEKFSTDPPDIAIIDIHMPGMNGLELIDSVRTKGIPIQFIILSGFGEFEYAQKAISFGVKQYLLKPIDQEKLKTALLETGKEVDENSDKSRWNLETAIKKALKNPSADPEGILDSTLDCRSQEIWLIAAEKGFPEIQERVNSLQQKGYQSINFLHNLEFEGMELLILAIEKDSGAEARYSFLSDLSKNFKNLQTGHVFAAGIPGSAGTISSQWEECRKKIQEYKLRDLLSIDETHIITHLSLAIQKLTVSVEGKNLDQMKKGIRELMAITAEYDLSLKKTKELLILVLNILNAGNKKKVLAMGISRQLDLMNSPDKELLEKSFYTIILQFMEWENRQDKTSHLPWLVEKTRQEIHNNFSNHTLSLRSFCSTVVFTNPDYLGKIFQKYMNLTFHAYLNHVRIEAAKQLILQNPYLTMYEAARQVGFGDNSQYFSRVFKGLEQISPSQFKEKIQRGLLI